MSMRPMAVGALALMALVAGAPAVARQDFDPTGWTTYENCPPIGDPNAKRVAGSRFTMWWETFPPTLRTHGPNSNLTTNRLIHYLCYEQLVLSHPFTDEFTPVLATHWKIETDEAKGVQTFWFHINPKARWSNGDPVTSEDVKASWWHRTQEDRKDPMTRMTYFEDFEEPVIVDKLTIRVTTKELNWRLFLYFGEMHIYPAKECRIGGDQYLEDYNWKLWTGTGPYMLKPEDLKKGDSLTLTRRNDWWAENEPWAKNTYNFERVKFLVVRDPEMVWEMFKKGDLDVYKVARAKRWVQEIPKEEIIVNGWAKRRKVWSERPVGFNGIVFNMREKPFNDKRVRLAFAHLYNREKLMDKIFFNEYEYLSSYFPGGGWGADTERIKFHPDKAEELLEEAGYKKRDDEGFLLDADGKRFELTLELGSPVLEPIYLVIKEDMEKAGIKLNLKTVEFGSLMKKISERKFAIHHQNWGGLHFPNPETSWRSDLADKPANNNTPGFKSAEVDALCKKYNVVFDRAEQKKIIQKIDRLIFDEHPYALAWYAPYDRFLYWDKFGCPSTYVTRYAMGDELEHEFITTWWCDPEREKAMLDARKAGTKLDPGIVDVKPWAGK